MKTVELGLLDRLTLLRVLDGFKTVGSFTSTMEKLAHMLDDVKGVGISEEEKVEAKIVESPSTSTESGRITWDPTYNKVKSIEFNDSTVEYIRAFLKDKDEKGEVTAADVTLINIKKLFA